MSEPKDIRTFEIERLPDGTPKSLIWTGDYPVLTKHEKELKKLEEWNRDAEKRSDT